MPGVGDVFHQDVDTAFQMFVRGYVASSSSLSREAASIPSDSMT